MADTPEEWEPHHLVGFNCWEEAFRDPSITPAKRADYVELGLGSEATALELNPRSFEAMV